MLFYSPVLHEDVTKAFCACSSVMLHLTLCPCLILAVIWPEPAGGVVLGADSRTSSGSYVANRVQDKITPLSGQLATATACSSHMSTVLVIQELSPHALSVNGFDCWEEDWEEHAVALGENMDTRATAGSVQHVLHRLHTR